VDFDRMLADKARYLAAIGRALHLRDVDSLTKQAETLREPTTTERPTADVDGTLEEARAVHAELCAAALPPVGLAS
jgi:hypothetical protein